MFLVRRNLIAHPLRSILTALAIALGVAMVLAAAIIGQAASEQANALTEASGPRIDLEIFARDQKPFAENTLATLRANADVELASPELQVKSEQLFVSSDRCADHCSLFTNNLVGVDPASYQALRKPELADGTFLSTDNAIVVPAALAIRNGWRTGDAIQLGSGDRVAQVTLGGRLKTEAGIPLGATPSALVPLSIAQQLAGAPGQIDHIEIQLRAGADVEKTRAELASALGAGFAVAQASVGGGPSFSTLTLQALLALVGVIILFAAGFVIANAFGMSITARLKEFGSLRTLGMTRRDILNLVLLEAGALGLAGVVGGVLVGMGIAWVTLWVIGYKTALNVPLWAVAFSPVMGLTVTLLSALLPAWQASRISPMEAVKSEVITGSANASARNNGRIGGAALALVILGLGVFGLLGRPDFATGLVVLLPSMVVLLAAMALLMPALVAPVATLVQPLLRRWPGGTAGRLAADNLRRNPIRAALTAAAMTAGLTMIIATSGLIPTIFKGGLKVFVTKVHEDRAIWPAITSSELRFDNVMEAFVDAPPLNPEMVARLKELEQRGAIELIDYDIARVPPELGAVPKYFGIFVEPETFIRSGDFDFIEGNPDDALKLLQRGRAVLIAPGPAARLNVHVGDDVKVQTPKGEVAFTVAGIGGVWIIMPVFPYADGQTYFGVGEPTMLGIVAKAGPDKAATLQRVDAIAKDYPVLVLNPADGFTLFDQAYDQLALVLDALLLMAVVVAGLGVVNTLVISVTERKREIGMLRAIGATQRQVRQMVMAEGATLGLLSVIFAIGLSLIILLAFILLVGPNGMGSLGISITSQQLVDTLSGAVREMSKAALACFFVAPLVAALAAYYPARQAAAMDVIDATRSEQLTLQPPSLRREEGEAERELPTSFTLFFLARVIQEQRTRFILSVLAVTIGVAATIASDYLGSSIVNLMMQSEDARTLGGGIFGQFDSILKLVGVSVSLAVGFLIFNAFAMSFTQRRQQLGTLRTLGTARAQIIRLALAEAALIGVVGTGLGLVLGQLLGRGFIAILRASSDVFNAFVERGTSLNTYLFASALGLGVPLLAMLLPALSAARLSPLVALKTPDTPPHASRITRPFFLLLLAPLLLLIRPPELEPPFDFYAVLLLTGVWMGLLALALPSALDAFSALARILLTRAGAVGLLMADNLRRARARTLITAITLTVGVTLILTVTGGATFWFQELMKPRFEQMRGSRIISITKIDPAAGLSTYTTQGSFRLTPDLIAAITGTFSSRAFVAPIGYTAVPELSGIGDGYFSFILDPADLRDHFKDVYFKFTEGDWEHAFPIMEQGCGVLVAPFIAKRNHAALYDTITVSSPLGKKVACTVAGIGQPFVSASIISNAAQKDFDSGLPMGYTLQPLPGQDYAALLADVTAFAAKYDSHIIEIDNLTAQIYKVLELMPVFLNGILLFAILAATLGVVNTTLIGLQERRRELGQLRAVGMTRKQTTWVVVGEAALIGAFGAGIGVIAGAGLILILVLTFGGKGMGIEDFPVYAATYRTLSASMVNGVAALVISPLLCALAAYLPIRNLVRGSAIATLNPEQVQPITRQRLAGVFNRGSIQTRFVLGTSVLLLIVLAGLIQVVTAHARNYLVNQLRDSASAMAGWNATMVELSLPKDAQTIDLAQLQQAQGEQGQTFDADSLLRFRSLIDDMTKGGLEQFALTDRDNVVVVSFDQREIGTTLDPVDNQKTVVREATVEGDATPRIAATAPIRNKAGEFVGSLRMTMRFIDLKNFLDRVRNTLWALGAVIVVLGLLASYVLSAPFTRTARTLAARAARVKQGNFASISHRQSLISFSIRTRLTVLMTILVVALVGGMGLVVIPIERQQLETTTRNGMLTIVQWIGGFMSESIPRDIGDLKNFDLAHALEMAQNLDFAKLQDLTEQTRGQSITYLTIADTEGTIVLSDKLSLQGEKTPTADQTQITDGEWRAQPIWIASTPLRQGREGEQIGTLSVAVSKAGNETFLNEARNLFWLTGLIAVLAGLLLAQALGGAVAAPVEQLVTGTRRVAQGDLSVRFRTGSRDELAQLGAAFNEMVAGLREREKLRDLFGRYVSPEVREAIESGRVTLAGERKNITVLYCDMRGSTTFAEQHKPEEVMTALNQYFEVIILATETYGGIVNRFVGDEAVCVFGAPTEYPDHAERAVGAALAMREGIKYLNTKRATLNLPILNFGIGLNTGLVIAGATGSEERQEYTLIGDAMNVGARIEQLNKSFPDYDILLSEFTKAALGERAEEFEMADLGEVEIRGKSKAVRVYGLTEKNTQ